jgi:hypothetical protein
VLDLAVMVHLEGREFPDAEALEDYADMIRGYADIFEAHGALLTLESNAPTVPSITFGNRFLDELEARGHGVGVHADLGGNPPPGYTVELFTADLVERRTQLESLGIDVVHVSGVCSPLDWVAAASTAGFSFVTGGVTYCLMSIPEADRPPGYESCPTPALCHDPWPADVCGRLHPRRMGGGDDWIVEDPGGPLVFLPASAGIHVLAGAADGESEEITPEDIAAYAALIEESLGCLDPDRVNQFYVSWSIGRRRDEATIDAWLDVADPYVRDGQARWRTLQQIHEEFVAWEAEH